ncbi:Death-associated protein-like 1-A [Oryzias melastigma]|uniref:Death associated protein 1b n=1 Tax=Oryzias melastigma TaxID=30732 RepID=A0A3B3B8E3_ORYME|nr:death associated protein 1b [Oryzias melastigma]KAF6726724.1 Death-associated protein-like 1-A [Oryzias melastigma]
MVQQQLPKYGTKENPLLKGGHRPAVKAGGKRVAKKGVEEGATHVTPEKDSKRADKPRSMVTPNRMQQVGILLTGSLDKLSHNFPETPVSVRHSKMCPAVEKPHCPRSFLIQQPRKW